MKNEHKVSREFRKVVETCTIRRDELAQMSQIILDSKKDFLRMAISLHGADLQDIPADATNVLLQRDLITLTTSKMIVMSPKALQEAITLL